MLRPGTGHSEWIGYQVIYGLGLELAMQTVGLAVQAVLAKSDVAIGTAIAFFAQQLGGSILSPLARMFSSIRWSPVCLRYLA